MYGQWKLIHQIFYKSARVSLATVSSVVIHLIHAGGCIAKVVLLGVAAATKNGRIAICILEGAGVTSAW